VEGICKECVHCERAWSAGRGASCHDTCIEFKEWERKEEEKPKVKQQKTYIPGGY